MARLAIVNPRTQHARVTPDHRPVCDLKDVHVANAVAEDVAQRSLRGLVQDTRDALAMWRLKRTRGDGVARALQAWHDAADHLKVLARFDGRGYQRVRLHREADFEVLLMCWEPSQATPIHDHDGQQGWITVIAGSLCVQDYRRQGGPVTFEAITYVESPYAPGFYLEPSEHVTVAAGFSVCEARSPETIHRVESTGERTLSVHVYARPIHSLVVFDDARRVWRRMNLD